MRFLLALFTFLIVYGSLYPFAFQWADYNEALLTPIFSFGLGDTGRGDMVANLLLFVPFGFLSLQSFPGRNRTLRIGLILLVAFVFAYVIQLAQIFVPGRTPSGSDAVWNLLGCGIGCAIACLPVMRYIDGLAGSGGLPSVPLVLGLLWLAYNWAPFVPSLDLQLIKDHLKLIVDARLDVWWLIQKVAMWLVIFHFLQESGSWLGREKGFAVLVLVVLTGSLFIVGHVTTIEHVAGGILAIPAWYLLRNQRRAPLLAALLGFAVLATTFAPFELRNELNSFHWIPFSGALGGNLLLNVMSIFKKLIVYASLIWLLYESRFSLRAASVTVACVLLLSELLQVFFRGPTPEVTDALMALGIGLGLHLYQMARAEAAALSGVPLHAQPAAPAAPPIEGNAPLFNASDENLQGIEVNLHHYQLAFLDQAAARLGCSYGQVCAELLALRAGQTSRSALSGLVVDASISHRDEDWYTFSLYLDQPTIEALQDLRPNPFSSLSSTLRQVLDEYLAGMADRSSVLQSSRVAAAPGATSFKFPLWLIGGLSVVGIIGVLAVVLRGQSPSFESSPGWAHHPASVVVDLHTHTLYSDGALSPDQLVELALNNGCNALAITDHSDKGGAAGADQLRDIAGLRQQYTDLILLAGIELNMPSYAGREHVNVITVPEHEGQLLRRLGNLAEDYGSTESEDANLIAAIGQYRDAGIPLVTLYNHASRKAASQEEILRNVRDWDPDGGFFNVLAGSPGHQKDKITGSYEPPLFTQDRWDPVVDEIGGVWDQLLARGYSIWGASASSDYHNRSLDEAPCAFSRTHLSVPERSPQGVLQAIDAGTFWADHGQILKRFTFSLELDGLERRAYPGDLVNAGSDNSIGLINVEVERGPGSAGKPLLLDLISSCVSGEAELVYTTVLGPTTYAATSLVTLRSPDNPLPDCFVRARVRVDVPAAPDLLAFTNPIRLRL
tara:strand:+ start:7323 stop:10184 length:2862 start_codon:yes stop_codon:yes gene_type:complete